MYFLFVGCHYQGECQDFVCGGGLNDTGNVSPAAVGTVMLGAQCTVFIKINSNFCSFLSGQ